MAQGPSLQRTRIVKKKPYLNSRVRLVLPDFQVSVVGKHDLKSQDGLVFPAFQGKCGWQILHGRLFTDPYFSVGSRLVCFNVCCRHLGL